MNPYDFEIERAAGEVRAKGARRVLVQAPDGLKQYLVGLHSRLSSEGAEVILSTDPCYGACDLADGDAGALGADLLIHVGHVKFDGRPERVPTLYLPAPHVIDMAGLARKAVAELGARGVSRVGLVAGTQHKGYIEEFAMELGRSGIEAITDGDTGGLVLGCRTAAAESIQDKVDAFLFIGGGEFHALGVAMAVDKDVFVADPYRDEIRDMARAKKAMMARRWWAIMEGRRAKAFGVVVVAKTGQLDMAGALRIKAALEARGRVVYLLSAGEVSWERLAGFGFVDVFIVTGCPRVPLDNREGFAKPVLSAAEAWELIGRV